MLIIIYLIFDALFYMFTCVLTPQSGVFNVHLHARELQTRSLREPILAQA